MINKLNLDDEKDKHTFWVMLYLLSAEWFYYKEMEFSDHDWQINLTVSYQWKWDEMDYKDPSSLLARERKILSLFLGQDKTQEKDIAEISGEQMRELFRQMIEGKLQNVKWGNLSDNMQVITNKVEAHVSSDQLWDDIQNNIPSVELFPEVTIAKSLEKLIINHKKKLHVIALQKFFSQKEEVKS